MRPFPISLTLLLGLAQACCAADRYVSTAGADTNPGTLASPWRHIDFAADNAAPGDTVLVRGGEYRERLTPARSGIAAAPITIRSFPGETAIIDGSGQAVGDETALVTISNRSHLTLEGLEIRNLSSASNAATPIGILINGAAAGIAILNCEIHNIRNGGNNGNAHGILAAGTAQTPITALLIRGNELRDLVLGNSEALVLNGNVDGFEVSENFVHDCNNLGIDLIGFEGTGPPGQDQARNGVCRGNTVTNISTVDNPAYNAPSAGGIYVDGGRDILIENNRVSHCDIGIEVASEAPSGTTSRVTVRNNLVWHNLIGGIFVGGYNARRGAAQDCLITGNTLYQNDTTGEYNGEILVQFNTSRLDIRNNILIAGAEKVFVIVNDGNNSDITLDYNLYHSAFAPSPGASEWIWSGADRSSFNSWKSASGQDSHSIYADPQFTAPATADFTIAPSSPARDTGDPAATASPGDVDASGNPRISGGRIDPGAHEFFVLSALQRWRQRHFGTTANSGVAADAADPDGDGLCNLLEFALADMDPNAADRTPISISAQPAPTVVFARNPDASAEITYRVMASADLQAWTPIATRTAAGGWTPTLGVTTSELTGYTKISDLRSDLPAGRHYRLEVTSP